METDKVVWEKCELDLTCYTNIGSPDRPHHCLQALASARALIVNHSTTNEIISHVLKTLVQRLQHDQGPFHQHVLKLLSDLALHRELSHDIVDKAYAYLLCRKDASRLTAKALGVLLAAAEHRQSFPTVSTSYELIEYFFLLCSSPSPAVRSWNLYNASKFCIPSSCLVKVFLKSTNDPYPNVRRTALQGLSSLRELLDVKDPELIESCYGRAVELLLDTNESVRSMAVRVVSEWGHMLATMDEEVGKMDWFDAIFVQLCTMVRDMSVDVRTEAFVVLGEMKLVSEDLLLQTLSKKIMAVIKKRKISGLCASKEFESLASYAAGIYVHGLEDEFNEVRIAACMSLGKLTILSVQFARDALNLLMDTLNDDTLAVRLHCLQIMYTMATSDCLKVQETHMHMFLGTLVDSNTSIRDATRNILRLMKLIDLAIFKSVVKGLLANLKSYPEDETDILNVMFCIGRSHGNFAVKFLVESFQELEPSYKEDLHHDGSGVAAILVLAISASLSPEAISASLTPEQWMDRIPKKLFNYAVPLLERISHSIRDVISQDTLFAYLSHCTRYMHLPLAEIFSHGECIPVAGETHSRNSEETMNNVSPLRQVSFRISKGLHHDNLWDPRHMMSGPEYQHKMTFIKEEESNTIGFILKTVAETWHFIKSGCTDEVQKTLRSCKEDLAAISLESNESGSLIAFACQYIRVVRLLGKVWQHFFGPRKFTGSKATSLDLSLQKLEVNLRRMRFGFLGFRFELELHIMEFILLTRVFRFCKAEICCRTTILKMLHATIFCVEHQCEKRSIKLSDFARELKLFCQEKSSDNDASSFSFHLKRITGLFSLKQLAFAEELKQIKAKLDVQGNNSENPLPYVSGFPAAITVKITVENVSSEDKLWLKMALEEFDQYVFVDFNQFEDHGCFREVTISVPFYRTPKAASFTLRACIAKECTSEEVQQVKCLGGPKHELTFLCKEKEVYFVTRESNIW